MYQLIKSFDWALQEHKTISIKRLADNAFIPFAVDNTDYAQFKVDLSEGAELLDAEGNTMSAEQVAEFLQTLP